MLSGVHTDHVATKSLRWGAFAAADGRSGRDRLLDAAERCLEVQGLAGTTMEDIARNAGVSRATVYRYFASREAVISGSSFAPPKNTYAGWNRGCPATVT